MGSVNVNRNVTDIFYRYKMPRLQAKVEGKGNGIKTVIVNMADVARALSRPATYPTKYFGCELGAQTLCDHKNERYVVNGSHEVNKLQDLLDGFIRKYVLCPKCDNPETTLTISAKNQTISQSCKACGHRDLLRVNHKVNTFIIKNPPEVNPAAQGSSLTEGKRSKRGGKKSGSDTNCTVSTNNVATLKMDGEVEHDVHNNTSLTAKNGNINDSANVVDDDDDVDWSVDVSKEAMRARMQDLSDGAKAMTITEDLEKTEKERIDIFYEIVKRKRDNKQLEDITTHKELVAEAGRLDILNKAPMVLAELLFTANIIQDARKYRKLLLRFTVNSNKAQRYLISGLEKTIELHADTLFNKVLAIFKLFYDYDILDEKTILEWDEKISKKQRISKTPAIIHEIHEKVQPFIEWLKNAEEEESSSEDEESDVDIEYDDRAPIDKPKVTVVATTPAANSMQKNQNAADDDGQEIDIDEI